MDKHILSTTLFNKNNALTYLLSLITKQSFVSFQLYDYCDNSELIRINMFLKYNPTIFLILFYFKISHIYGQASNAPHCTTPDQIAGTCISINNCPSLYNLLTNHNTNSTIRNYLRNSVCQYVQGQNPIVCCPANPQTTRSTGKVTLPETPNCGFSNISNPRIVNGVPAKAGEFPWIVALGYRNSKNPQMPKWLCGGALITNKHVLTAAHCVYNRPDLYVARLGDLDLFSDDDGARPSTILLANANIHKDYNPRKYSSDIAILTLKEAVNNPTVWPICLPVKEPFRSMTYLNFQPTLAGWGSVSFNGPSSSSLQQIFVPVLDNQQCSRVFSRAATIDEKIICAGSLNGDKDACGGDSGGPLMHVVSEGHDHYRVYEIGIVSYGFRCAQPGYPGVYTRLTAFLDWIQDNLN